MLAASARKNRSYLSQLGRLVRYKLVVPLRRAPHSPEYKARGVAIGMIWAMTPLVGIQMYLVSMTWLVMRRSPKTDFSLIIGCAWTWVSNVFTVPPIYYTFYITGQLMRGQWHDVAGFQSFMTTWDELFLVEGGFWEQIVALTSLLFESLGISMAIGCLPWAVVMGWLSYKMALSFAVRRQARKKAP